MSTNGKNDSERSIIVHRGIAKMLVGKLLRGIKIPISILINATSMDITHEMTKNQRRRRNRKLNLRRRKLLKQILRKLLDCPEVEICSYATEIIQMIRKENPATLECLAKCIATSSVWVIRHIRIGQ